MHSFVRMYLVSIEQIFDIVRFKNYKLEYCQNPDKHKFKAGKMSIAHLRKYYDIAPEGGVSSQL